MGIIFKSSMLSLHNRGFSLKELGLCKLLAMMPLEVPQVMALSWYESMEATFINNLFSFIKYLFIIY